MSNISPLGLRHIHEIKFYETLESTNDEALRLIKEEQKSGTVIFAHEQTKGRGRLGRSWSMVNGDLAFSLLLVGAFRNDSLSFLPLTAALAVLDALLGLGIKAALKWPNDIVVLGSKVHKGYLSNYEKIGGILVENLFLSKATASVIGMGINFKHKKALKVQVPHAAFLNEIDANIDAITLFNAILQKLDHAIEDFDKPGTKENILSRYQLFCATLGQQVRVNYGGKEICGLAHGLACDGGLLIMSDGKEYKIHAGDVIAG